MKNTIIQLNDLRLDDLKAETIGPQTLHLLRVFLKTLNDDFSSLPLGGYDAIRFAEVLLESLYPLKKQNLISDELTEKILLIYDMLDENSSLGITGHRLNELYSAVNTYNQRPLEDLEKDLFQQGLNRHMKDIEKSVNAKDIESASKAFTLFDNFCQQCLTDKDFTQIAEQYKFDIEKFDKAQREFHNQYQKETQDLVKQMLVHTDEMIVKLKDIIDEEVDHLPTKGSTYRKKNNTLDYESLAFDIDHGLRQLKSKAPSERLQNASAAYLSIRKLNNTLNKPNLAADKKLQSCGDFFNNPKEQQKLSVELDTQFTKLLKKVNKIILKTVTLGLYTPKDNLNLVQRYKDKLDRIKKISPPIISSPSPKN